MKLKAAIKAINEHGMLLVFPIDNAAEPQSLWSVAYPRSKMRWEWDEDGDDRVSKLWFLREELSRSGEVIYSKWYRGRATCFSKELFKALLSPFVREGDPSRGLSPTARDVLHALEIDSPLSTKGLKEAVGLKGKSNEAAYNRALNELWARNLIVAFGEIDEGAFPSLAIGATKVIFEDLYREAQELAPATAEKRRAELFEKVPGAARLYMKARSKLVQSTAPGRRRHVPAVVEFADVGGGRGR